MLFIYCLCEDESDVSWVTGGVARVAEGGMGVADGVDTAGYVTVEEVVSN